MCQICTSLAGYCPPAVGGCALKMRLHGVPPAPDHNCFQNVCIAQFASLCYASSPAGPHLEGFRGAHKGISSLVTPRISRKCCRCARTQFRQCASSLNDDKNWLHLTMDAGNVTSELNDCCAASPCFFTLAFGLSREVSAQLAPPA